jgi:hypothetical protein
MAELVFKPDFVHAQPIFKTLAEIRNGAKIEPGASLLGIYGLTDHGFDFPKTYIKDWKVVSQSPLQRKFEGTVLILRVRPVVTLPGDFRKWPDVIDIIAKHEKLHVHDAQELIRGPLQHALKGDAMFKTYFFDRAPISEETYHHMFPEEIDQYVRKTFQDLWDAKVSERDTPAKYAPVAAAIEAALIRHRK